MIVSLDVDFDFNEIVDYYRTLEKDYQHLKWTLELVKDVDGAEGHSVEGAFGWGIQSNLEDLSVPCPPYDIHKHGSKIYRDTELVFGFAEKLKQFFGPVRQLSIASHPPGVIINTHIDNPEYFKIHIPIFSNDKSFFNFENQSYVMEPGKMYCVFTELPHGTANMGDTDRVHLMFKLPMAMRESILDISGKL